MIIIKQKNNEEVTLVDRFNSFWDLVAINPFSKGQVALYMALLDINNRSYWSEWFSVPNSTLMQRSGMTRQGILQARNELKQRGLIDFKTRGTLATVYKLHILKGNKKITTTMTDNCQVSCQDNCQVSCQDNCQVSCTLIDKDIDKDTLSCSSAEKSDERESAFAKIYAIYPKKQGKAKAYEYYCGWLKGRVINGKKIKLNNRQMWDAVDRYVKQCQENGTELKYYKDFSTFMNKSILDYLEGENDEIS